jgi:hypothetical protein
MFDICPVVFFKMIVTMLVGHNNRQCLMLVSGDVLTGKSLLISVLKEVVGGGSFSLNYQKICLTQKQAVCLWTPQRTFNSNYYTATEGYFQRTESK